MTDITERCEAIALRQITFVALEAIGTGLLLFMACGLVPA